MSSSFRAKIVQDTGIPAAKFDEALRLCQEQNISIVAALISLKLSEPQKILQTFAEHYNIQVADLDNMDIPENIITLIEPKVAKKLRVIPIDRAGNNIIVAMENPLDLKSVDLIRFQTGYSIKPVAALPESITKALERYYGAKNIDFNQFGGEESDQTGLKKKVEQRAVIGDESSASNDMGPVIKMVDQILIQCLQRRASDIHIEPYETNLRVRLRIDGSLLEIARPPLALRDSLTTRVKIMANMNIAEKRVPQDGGIRVLINGKPIDFRVNCMPTIWGEKIVLRILDKSTLQVDMTKLGFEPDDLERFKEAISKPFGMVLVTGPTGSGKTVTLYSALAELNKITDCVVTAEDPVEFNLEGINQVNVNPVVGLDFSSALKAFLRQDPDVIMVGEIRDKETGEIALKAALTGHMVLSTLHTNSAADTIVRLINMGLESFNLISALNAVVAQRLARKICEKCRVVDESLTPEMLIKLGIPAQFASKVKAYKGAGCHDCGGTGNRGRTAIHEVMVISDPIREAIMKGEPAMTLKAIGISQGMRTLRQNGLNKLIRGIIDVMELTSNTAADETK